MPGEPNDKTFIGRPKSADAAKPSQSPHSTPGTQETLPLPETPSSQEAQKTQQKLPTILALAETLGPEPVRREDLPPEVLTETPLVIVPEEFYSTSAEIGRGGLGRVISAVDRRLEREVALKEMLKVNPKSRERFIREAKLTARLQHPGVVPVYEVGSWPTGEPFYAMKLVGGRSLAQLIKETQSLSARLSLLPNVLASCEAVGYAHSKRIIHRDLKPHNILVGEYGETIVIDWGLAKELGFREWDMEHGEEGERQKVESTSQEKTASTRGSSLTPASDSSRSATPSSASLPPPMPSSSRPSASGASMPHLTLEGAVLGTPAYMPPEQARGKEVDERADVYALGAILYHVLCGEPPYDGGSLEILKKLHQGPPTPLEQRDANIPPELLAIVRKAMARRAKERYSTAKEMAEDLLRYQNGQLVGVYQYSPGEHLLRFIKKHKGTFQVGALLSFLLISVLIYAFFSVNSARTLAQKNFKSATQAKKEAEQNLINAISAQKQAEQNLKASERGQMALLESQGRQALLQGHPNEAARYLSEAYAKGEALGELSPTLRFLTAAAMRKAESLRLSFEAHKEEITNALFSPDEKCILTASKDKTAKLWRLSDGKLLTTFSGEQGSLNAISFGAQGKVLLTASDDGSAILWEVSTGKLLFTIYHEEPISDVAFGPKGDLFATASWDKTIKLWDINTGALLKTLEGHDDFVSSISFSRDGETLASASWDKTVKLWSVKSGRAFKTFKGHTDTIWSVSFSSDEEKLLTVSKDKTAKLWDAKTGRLLLTLSDTIGIGSASLSWDTETLLTTNRDNTAKLWSAKDGKLIKTFIGHTDFVWGAGFLPDGERILTLSRDRTVKLWSIKTGKILASIEHAQNVTTGWISSNNKTLFTVSDKKVFLWGADAFGAPKAEAIFSEGVRALAFRRDGKGVASITDTGAVSLWNSNDEEPTELPKVGAPQSVFFTKSDAHLLTVDESYTPTLWDLATKKPLETLAGNLWSATPSPGGEKLLMVRRDKTGQVISLTKKEAAISLQQFSEIPNDVAFSPDLSRVAVATVEGPVKVWSAKTGARLFSIDAHIDGTESVTFSPDSQKMLTAGWDQTAKLWDVRTGKLLSTLQHTTSVIQAEFSPDGAYIMTITNIRSSFLWDAKTGQLLRTLEHPGGVDTFAFSPRSDFLATAGQEGTIYLWDVKHSTLLYTFAAHAERITVLSFSPQGDWLASASADKTVRLWEMKPEGRPAKVLQKAIKGL